DHGVCDEIIPEPTGGAHSDWKTTGAHLEDALDRVLSELTELTIDELLESRWAKYEAIGAWREA
ncbi:MAG: acetyl-CoA carboxylase carboxyl transferase subunit alpha, partial [Gemmatimonadota bacterium]|nr:acetyl-CoA carboxylase carboxyl transferase subunit alpha [Gemmatimonadota bacterium]